VLACPRCDGRLRLVALIEQAAVIERILRHLGLPDTVPAPSPARAPPAYGRPAGPRVVLVTTSRRRSHVAIRRARRRCARAGRSEAGGRASWRRPCGMRVLICAGQRGAGRITAIPSTWCPANVSYPPERSTSPPATTTPAR
jgi:hypothetical protein